MTEGTSQGLFIVVAIVIFGIFVSLSYTLFGKTLQPQMVQIFESSFETVNVSKDKNPNYDVNGKISVTDTSNFLFEESTGTIIGYTGLANNLVIPYEIDGVAVEHIGDYAFNRRDNKIEVNLTSVIIPNTVKTIGNMSFDSTPEQRSINKINLGLGVEKVGYAAFGYTNITSLKIPDSLKIIGDASFANNNLTSLEIPNSVISIGNQAFKNPNTLREVSIQNKAENIKIHNLTFSGSTPNIIFKGAI